MSQMFEGCKLLRNLNLSNFNTKNVVNMGNMFSVCKLLKHFRQIKILRVIKKRGNTQNNTP